MKMENKRNMKNRKTTTPTHAVQGSQKNITLLLMPSPQCGGAEKKNKTVFVVGLPACAVRLRASV